MGRGNDRKTIRLSVRRRKMHDADRRTRAEGRPANPRRGSGAAGTWRSTQRRTTSDIADGYGNKRVIVVDAASGAYKRRWRRYGKVPVVRKGSSLYTLSRAVPKQGATACDCRTTDLGSLMDRANNTRQVFRTDGT